MAGAGNIIGARAAQARDFEPVKAQTAPIGAA
jgi:hypothetical protein